MITKWIRLLAKTVVLVLFLLWTVVPIILVVSNSFKNQMDIFSVPPNILLEPTLDNYIKAITCEDFGRYFLYSFRVGAISWLLLVGLGELTRYLIVFLKLE